MAKRDFFTGSTRIIGDPRPSGLDLRVYACVSMHDGMSLKNGKGRGCYATFATLTTEINCDASNLSKSLKRLVEWGYVTEERQVDRRRKAYRIVFEFADAWSNDQQSIVGEITNEPLDETANDLPEIVGNGECRNGGNPLLTGQHYSSLKVLDASEEEKLDSAEAARFAARGLSKIEFAQNVGAQLAALERALKAGDQINLVEWYGYVGSIWEIEEHRGRATRLAEELAELMSEEEFEQCAGTY